MIGIEAQRAVCATERCDGRVVSLCALSPELRHLIMVLAVLANRETGRGTSGQQQIGAAMGVSERTVRRLLAELSARLDSPVRVERRQRRRADGYRTSDAYQLVLVSPVTDDRRGAASHRTLAAGDSPVTDDRSSAGSHRSREATSPVTGGTPHRSPASALDPRSDPRSDPRRSSPRETAASTSPKRRRPSKPEREADPRLLPLRDFYVARYQAANQGAAPAFSRATWGRAMRAFAELLDAAKSDERARLCIERTFSSPDAFTRRRCQPWEIATDANKLLADTPRKGQPWVQRGGGERDLDAAVRRGAERFGGGTSESPKQEGWGLAPPGEPEDLPTAAGGGSW